MYTNENHTNFITGTQPVPAFGVTWSQSAMSLPEPAQSVSGLTHVETNGQNKARGGPLNGPDDNLSLVQRLQKQQLKFEQLHARANVRWQRFWSSQILDCRTRLAAIAANDLDLAGKLKQRLSEYESKLSQEKNGPWVSFYQKEIKLCQTRLADLEGAK